MQPGWASSEPRGRWCAPGRRVRPAGTRRLPAAGPRSPAFCLPPAEVLMTRHQRGFTHVHPSGLSLACRPRTERGPSGFPRASHPAVTSGACQGGNRSQALTRATPPTSADPPIANSLTTVRSTRGALPALPLVGFPESPPAPGVRLSAHRALHKSRRVWCLTSCCARPRCRDLCSPVVVAPVR